MSQALRRYAVIALSMLGSATLLFSCNNKPQSTVYDYETLMTESSENRTITMMENGLRSYTFTTPLMEGYSMATNPYQEFRRGIEMTTFTSDSTNLQDATITANYAIYYENQKLWEAKGNVVIIKNNREEGDTTITGHTEIYTQQLFWNATTKKIYSNVDTKILQPDGWHFGVGFDADEDLKNIHFRKYSSEMEFDMSQPTPEELEANSKTEEKKAEDKKDEGKKTESKAREKQPDNKSNRPTPNPSRPTSPPKANSNRTVSPSTNSAPKVEAPKDSRVNAPQNNIKPNVAPQREQQKLSTSMNIATDLGVRESNLNVDIAPAK